MILLEGVTREFMKQEADRTNLSIYFPKGIRSDQGIRFETDEFGIWIAYNNGKLAFQYYQDYLEFEVYSIEPGPVIRFIIEAIKLGYTKQESIEMVDKIIESSKVLVGEEESVEYHMMFFKGLGGLTWMLIRKLWKLPMLSMR